MKTCIVTGAASGIGLATTRLLIERGWRVAALDRDAAAIGRAADGVETASGGDEPRPLSWHRVDIVDERAVDEAIAAIVAEGPISGLVNSAGIGIAKPFVDTTADDLRRLYDVNVVGTFIVAKAVVRAMQASRSGGAIVNLASTAGQVGHIERTAYGTTKAAIVVLTQIMAVELAADRIRVNAVSPGPVATPLVDAMHTDAMRRRWTDRTPQRRYGEPREIAEAIAFLLDESRSSFVTGHVLNVDGGLLSAGLMP